MGTSKQPDFIHVQYIKAGSVMENSLSTSTVYVEKLRIFSGKGLFT